MFEPIGGRQRPQTKCFLTHGSMGNVDPKQPPTKRKPFTAFLAQPFVHKIELILPERLYEAIKADVLAGLPTPQYLKVILSLQAIVEGDFFNKHIKKGNVLMLSEPRHEGGNSFTITEGILTLRLTKETYERVGLAGKVDETGGRRGSRGVTSRWVVRLNLRLPSMIHGKKLFDRLVYACRTVLSAPITWLFIELAEKGLSSMPPLADAFPKVSTCSPTVAKFPSLLVPKLHPLPISQAVYKDAFVDSCSELYEWLSLISLASPRLSDGEQIDPFLSRYSPPDSAELAPKAVELVKITWEGFMSSSYTQEIMVKVESAAASTDWFALTALGFSEIVVEGRDCTALRLPGLSKEYILWEIGI